MICTSSLERRCQCLKAICEFCAAAKPSQWAGANCTSCTHRGTPPPDIDLSVWAHSFAAILARRPHRLFLTHFGYSDDPAAHIAEFRERLHRWAGWAADALRTAPTDAAAQQHFEAASRAEMEER